MTNSKKVKWILVIIQNVDILPSDSILFANKCYYEAPKNRISLFRRSDLACPIDLTSVSSYCSPLSSHNKFSKLTLNLKF